MAMNRLIGHTRSNTQATSWGKQEANGRWVASASRGGGVDKRTVGRSSVTRWDVTTSRCEWRRGSRMHTWDSGAMIWYVRTSRQKRGKREEIRQQTSGGSLSRGRGGVLRGRKAEAAWQQWYDNQLANKRPTGGNVFADKRRWIVDRMRSGSSVTRGIVTISWRHQRTRGGSVYKGVGTLNGWEVEVVRQEDKRMRQHVVKMTGGGGCGATRGDTTTSQGKLEKWIGGGHTGWQLADKRRRRSVTFTKRWNVCLTKFALLDFMWYVMFLCFRVQFRTKQMKCFFAYVICWISYHICLYVFMFLGMLQFRDVVILWHLSVLRGQSVIIKTKIGDQPCEP